MRARSLWAGAALSLGIALVAAGERGLLSGAIALAVALAAIALAPFAPREAHASVIFSTVLAVGVAASQADPGALVWAGALVIMGFSAAARDAVAPLSVALAFGAFISWTATIGGLVLLSWVLPPSRRTLFAMAAAVVVASAVAFGRSELSVLAGTQLVLLVGLGMLLGRRLAPNSAPPGFAKLAATGAALAPALVALALVLRSGGMRGAAPQTLAEGAVLLGLGTAAAAALAGTAIGGALVATTHNELKRIVVGAALAALAALTLDGSLWVPLALAIGPILGVGAAVALAEVRAARAAHAHSAR